MSVQRSQRFTRENPCPVCRGYEQAGRGQGKRCHGFRSDDGNFAYCTREEWSGDALRHDEHAGAWVHDLRRAPATERGGYSTRNGEHLRVLPPAPPREKTMCYDYHDADGTLRYQVVRYPDKRFVQRRPDGKGGWLYNLDGVTRLLYRLPALLASGPDTPVYIVEGEKDVNTLRALGLVATTNSEGAGKWRAECNRYLSGRQVVIVPDNDDAGWNHARAVAASLAPVAACVKVITLPDVAEKGDVTDWLNGSGSLAALTALAEAQECWDVPEVGQGDHHKVDDPLDPLDPPLVIGPRFVHPGTVVMEQVRWLWRGYIPLGKLAVVDGDPGLGKSTMMTDLAARVTNGDAMPDGSPGLDEPAGVLILSAEDGIGDTILPRLEAAGAHMDRVRIFDVIGTVDGERLPTLDDRQAIEAGIRAVDARLVIIDPFMAYLPPHVNAYRDQDVRRVLAPLGKLAERTGAAIVIVRHPNKMVGMSALHRGGGSIGIIGAVRAGLLVAPDPHDSEGPRRVLAVVKNNLAPPAPSFAYHIETAANAAGRIVWEGQVAFTANQLTAAPSDGEERSALREAMDFLRDALADGPQPVAAVTQSAKSAGISEITLKRARREGRIAGSRGGSGVFVWQLPDVPSPVVIRQVDHLDHLDHHHVDDPDDPLPSAVQDALPNL